MASGNQHPVFARGDKKQPGTQKRRSRFDRYGDTPDSLIDDLTMLKATAEARLRICGDDHKAAAALIRESRCIDEAVAKDTWVSGEGQPPGMHSSGEAPSHDWAGDGGAARIPRGAQSGARRSGAR